MECRDSPNDPKRASRRLPNNRPAGFVSSEDPPHRSLDILIPTASDTELSMQ